MLTFQQGLDCFFSSSVSDCTVPNAYRIAVSRSLFFELSNRQVNNGLFLNE